MKNRILYFLATIIVPVVFSYWLFIPMALLYIYLAKIPYEIILVGLVLDSVYYFGSSFLEQHFFTIFSILLIILAFFLNKRLDW